MNKNILKPHRLKWKRQMKLCDGNGTWGKELTQQQQYDKDWGERFQNITLSRKQLPYSSCSAHSSYLEAKNHKKNHPSTQIYLWN